MAVDYPSTGGLPYGLLKATHPDYDAGYWRQLEAFYAGGKKLLRDATLMREVFPPHTNEDPDIYAERCKRAFFLVYAGAILDYLCSALRADPVEVTEEGEGEDATPDPFYVEFNADCSAPGGTKLPFSRLLAKRMLSALIFRRAWTLVDLPASDPEGYANLREQETVGALDAYVCPLTPYEVLDWEESEDGELLWLMRCQRSCRRLDPARKREIHVETYTLYTPTDWTRYVVEYKDQSQGGLGPPTDDTIILGVTSPHSFGRVPVARMELDEGLWAMDRLESPVREHFNKLCAKGWFEYKCAYPLLYEFTGPEIPGVDTPVSNAQEDPYRAINQRRGIGYVQVRGQDDKAAYVACDAGVLQYLAESIRSLKDEIYRVLFSMALSTDNSAAALGRSADSKGQDKAVTSVILVALGEYLRDHAVDIYDLVAAGRREKKTWTASGADTFDPVALSEMIEQIVLLEGVSIPSPTFQRLLKGGAAKRIVAADASDEDKRAIDEELANNITADQFDPAKIAEKDQGDAERQAELDLMVRAGKQKGVAA